MAHGMDRLRCRPRWLGRVGAVVEIRGAGGQPRHGLTRLRGLAVADVPREDPHPDRRENRGEREEIHQLDRGETAATAHVDTVPKNADVERSDRHHRRGLVPAPIGAKAPNEKEPDLARSGSPHSTRRVPRNVYSSGLISWSCGARRRRFVCGSIVPLSVNVDWVPFPSRSPSAVAVIDAPVAAVYPYM